MGSTTDTTVASQPRHDDQPSLHVPAHPVRFVTAASLFDGHDAAINIMRRILQSQGAEVIHLGHDRSVNDVVTAALQEDVQGIAISSYQGGHVEYFTYLVEELARRGRPDIRVYGGGGGVIVAEEIALLHARGVARIFSPEDGQRYGLPGMVNLMIAECDREPAPATNDLTAVINGDETAVAQVITAAERGRLSDADRATLATAAARRNVPVLGITGTGGAGKSSLTDELLQRIRRDHNDTVKVGVLAIDPSRRRGGGALLGDRIRMNAISDEVVYFRSLATRDATRETPACLADAILILKAAGYDLVIVETPGIGQGDAGIVSFVDVSLYVMTPEFGAASQLEKIDMLDFADVVAVNKFERRGAEDARRDVARQLVRNREAFGQTPDDMPVFGTSAARFADDGVTALYHDIKRLLAPYGFPAQGRLATVDTRVSTGLTSVLPASRDGYLSAIADTVRTYHADTEITAGLLRERQHLDAAAALLNDNEQVRDAIAIKRDGLSVAAAASEAVDTFHRLAQAYRQEQFSYTVRDQSIDVPLTRTTLSGTVISRVAVPHLDDHGAIYRFVRRENFPGYFPYTAGVFPFKRDGEAPARMFAGEGDPARTNRRFHLLAQGQPATRLSTAFDSVTLYGRNPEERPDVYGKVGTSGVSVATLDDMRELYAGFDLCASNTSVSMTINGPAPTILAMFLNTAIDQQLDRFKAEQGRDPSAEEEARVRADTLTRVRGTVQADILKEDQGQNTCIFSTEFALRCMADVQEYFITHNVKNFYSVSISGYHIAEAGANPITQLAFTLANAFTYVEAYLARGMDVNKFAPNFSFFFSNGMDAEYTVIGRVARRIWAIALRDRYGADDRAQKLKYHIQTSGRSLHAQEMAFNDIRTTLQALCAVYDNTNSLHTNAYDEAVTTPSAASVRRALAIQHIIGEEWGLAQNENPLQGAAIIDELTDLVEEAVLTEFDRLSQRGGVLGAMETGYQRGRIQDESMLYEQKKHDGSLPIIGVNTFLAPKDTSNEPVTVELARATEDEKRRQLARLEAFKHRNHEQRDAVLARLEDVATANGNLFAVLMDAVRVASLGEITDTLFRVGGQYRRNV